jgi:hypothetical protein
VPGLFGDLKKTNPSGESLFGGTFAFHVIPSFIASLLLRQ